MKILLNKDGVFAVAELQPFEFDSEGDYHIMTPERDEAGDLFSIYQLVELSFPNGEFDVDELQQQVIDQGVTVAFPSVAGVVECSAFVTLTTLACLGFDFKYPEPWEAEMNAPLDDEHGLVIH